MIDLEINYDAGRISSTYEKDTILLNVLNERHSDIIHIINQRYKMCHKVFDDVCDMHKACLSTETLRQMPERQIKYYPDLLQEYHFLIENWIFNIRRTLDSIVQLAALKCLPEDNIYNGKIDCAGIEGLLKDGASNAPTCKLLFGSESVQEIDPTNFLSLVNDIFNAMKHHWIREKSHNTMGIEVPTVYVLYRKYNNPENALILHNHNAFHIMMGFQDMFRSLIKNIISENLYNINSPNMQNTNQRKQPSRRIKIYADFVVE